MAGAPCLWAVLALVLPACDSAQEECLAVQLIQADDFSDLGTAPSCLVGDIDLEDWNASELERLRSVVRIVGNLSLRRGRAQDLRGLESLEHIEGHLYIESNDKLATLAGLDRLTTVGGSLTLADNRGLHDVDGLNALESVGLSFGVYGCESLQELRGVFLSLSEVGQMRISDNASLAAVDIRSLDAISALEIADNRSLKYISVQRFSSVESATIIARNEQLVTLEGDASGRGPDIHSAASLLVFQNPKLRAIEGFSGIRRLGPIAVFENDALESLVAFPDLEVGMGFSLEDNPSLSTLRLPRLRQIDTTLRVVGNTSLGDGPATTFAAAIDAEVRKVGGNSLDWEPLDPCPWLGDGICDAPSGRQPSRTRLCVTDSLDCN